jgi:hypothetical protein
LFNTKSRVSYVSGLALRPLFNQIFAGLFLWAFLFGENQSNGQFLQIKVKKIGWSLVKATRT